MVALLNKRLFMKKSNTQAEIEETIRRGDLIKLPSPTQLRSDQALYVNPERELFRAKADRGFADPNKTLVARL